MFFRIAGYFTPDPEAEGAFIAVYADAKSAGWEMDSETRERGGGYLFISHFTSD